MARVTAAIEVDRPPEEVFAIVAAPARRRLLLPDNFRDARIISEVSAGPGARTRFTIVTPHGEYESEVEITAWEPPNSLTEHTEGVDGYTMRWTFAPVVTGTRVSVTSEYTVRGSFLHRLVDRWFARKALENSLLVELTRLKQAAEGNV